MYIAMISGVECLVDKGRGKHDMTSVALAGCATGAALAAGQGIQVSILFLCLISIINFN